MKTKQGIDWEAASLPSPIARPYNSYNIFFILERVRFIEAQKNRLGPNVNNTPKPQIVTNTGYEGLNLPPLPPRFAHLESVLPSNWYCPGKNAMSTRKHERTHGCKW